MEDHYLINKNKKVFRINNNEFIDESDNPFGCLFDWAIVTDSQYNTDLLNMVLINESLIKNYKISDYTKNVLNSFSTNITPEEAKQLYNNFNIAFIIDQIKNYIENEFLQVVLTSSSIEFRITSKNYDWAKTITLYLYKEFKNVSRFPSNLMITRIKDGTILYDDTALNFVSKFDKSRYEEILEDFKESEIANSKLIKLFKDCCEEYTQYK